MNWICSAEGREALTDVWLVGLSSMKTTGAGRPAASAATAPPFGPEFVRTGKVDAHAAKQLFPRGLVVTAGQVGEQDDVPGFGKAIQGFTRPRAPCPVGG